MSLENLRRTIRPLLNERDPADALAAHYAFYHPDARTHLIVRQGEAGQTTGYLAISRTGMDLFRPLVTLRLPPDDLNSGLDLITNALPEGSAVILYAPTRYGPLLKALFDFETDEQVRLLVLDQNRFEPIINVLVTQATSPDGLPRFVIRSQKDPGQVAAAAGLNWQTRYFAEISVQTSPGERRQGWGRSVVAAMVHHLLQNGRTPLYVAGENNQASLQLAESIGFRDSGKRMIFAQATRKNPL
jgi:ribosomal protein S18 acetylase RimI-like enzyme